MLKPGPAIPLEFLLYASRRSLEDFELSRLNHVALLAKRLRETLHEMVEESALAMLARVLIENERLRSMTVDPLQESFNFSGNAFRDEPCGIPTAGHPKSKLRDAANAA
jgi:hypothetical protein